MLDCFDLINAYGSRTPSALGWRAGLHLATIIGILDRLECGGWISRDSSDRDRDPSDCDSSRSAPAASAMRNSLGSSRECTPRWSRPAPTTRPPNRPRIGSESGHWRAARGYGAAALMDHSMGWDLVPGLAVRRGVAVIGFGNR